MSHCDAQGRVRGDDGRYQLHADHERVCVCGCPLGVHASEPPYDCLDGDCGGCERFRDAHAKLSPAMRWALLTDEPRSQPRATVRAMEKRGLIELELDLDGGRDSYTLTERGIRVRDYLLAQVAAANAASKAGAR